MLYNLILYKQTDSISKKNRLEIHILPYILSTLE